MTDPSYVNLDQNNRLSRLNLIGMWTAIIACLIVLLGMSSPENVSKSSKRLVTSMPGWPSGFSKDFNLYSGSLSIATTSQEKTLFYTFVTSQNDPINDPVILWLNGGPGCSSLLGFLNELGPYLLDPKTGMIAENDFSWNENANVLFLESPAGVGFSTANNSNETYNDETAMVDQYEGLQEFFKLFPGFIKNELWLTGESYAGTYVPHLAYYIDLQNYLKSRVSLNLKGFMVGNAFTSEDTISKARLDFYLESNLCTKEEYDNATELSKECHEEIAIYSLAAPSCQKFFDFFNEKTAGSNFNPHDISQACLAPANTSLPCYNFQTLEGYLNKREVKAALGVPNSIQWEVCNHQIENKYRLNLPGSIVRYTPLIEKKYKILIFSGDTDAVIPYTDSVRWIEGLGLALKEETRFWYLEENRLGGNVTEYDGLTFATIKGAGHMAPEMKKEENLWLIEKFMNGEKI